jgi:hypothetical protein
MTPLNFNFGNALFHAFRTGGPKGFIWKFALAYGLLALLIATLSVWLQWPVYEIYFRMASEGGDPSSYVDEINRASMRNLGASALILPLSLAMYAVFEAASQRRYIRGEGFSLKIGADEGRVAIVLLLWFVMLIGWYIGFFVFFMIMILLGAMVGMSGGDGGAPILIGIIAVLGILISFAILLWGAARFSPASAMTIRDNQIRFFEAWRVTRKKSGTIMLAMLTFCIVYFLMAAIIFGPVIFSAIQQIAPLTRAGGNAGADMLALMRTPAFYGPIAAGYVLYVLAAAAWFHIFGGPAALAAKTDPAWSGRAGVSEEFS